MCSEFSDDDSNDQPGIINKSFMAINNVEVFQGATAIV